MTNEIKALNFFVSIAIKTKHLYTQKYSIKNIPKKNFFIHFKNKARPTQKKEKQKNIEKQKHKIGINDFYIYFFPDLARPFFIPNHSLRVTTSLTIHFYVINNVFYIWI